MDNTANVSSINSPDPNVSSSSYGYSDQGNTDDQPGNEPVDQPLPTPKESINPIKQASKKINHPPLLWNQLQEVYVMLEQKLGGSVVGYYTSSAIVGDDVKYFYTHLESGGFRDKIYFVLYTSGGDGKSAYRIASLLKSFCKELIVIVPEMAASAGTMLCLAGDKIIMSPLSFLTAVDTSVVHPLNPRDAKNKPARIELEEVRRAVEVLEKNLNNQSQSDVYKTIFNYIHPIAYGNVSRTSNLSEMLCRDLLALRSVPMSEQQANLIIEKLNHSLPSHGYPITRDIALELGLPVEKTTPDLDTLLWKFLNLNRALTEPVRTDIGDSYFYNEKILNVIESVGRRLHIIHTYEKRFEPVIKGWMTTKEQFKWEATYKTVENGESNIIVSRLNL